MFYEFRQTNSGGFNVIDKERGLNKFVIIEASSPEKANRIATDHVGIYFDGCAEGLDCSCCGDRWNRADSYDGGEEPSLYGSPITDFYKDGYYNPDDISIIYMNGKIETV